VALFRSSCAASHYESNCVAWFVWGFLALPCVSFGAATEKDIPGCACLLLHAGSESCIHRRRWSPSSRPDLDGCSLFDFVALGSAPPEIGPRGGPVQFSALAIQFSAPAFQFSIQFLHQIFWERVQFSGRSSVQFFWSRFCQFYTVH